MERIIKVDSRFKEESFNYRPLFNKMNGEDEPIEEEWKVHPYYHRRPDYEKNTLKRLKRMY